MPIPGSVLSGLNFDPSSVGSVVYPSLGTFYRVVKAQAADGQETHTFALIDAAHTSIQCRKSPFIIIRPQTQEMHSGQFQQTEAKEQVNFAKGVPDVSVEWQLMVDGVIYQIVSRELDGNGLTTRVGIGIITPFNA